MVNIIWAFMAIIGIVYAMLNGTMSQVNKALFQGANEAVTLTIGLISVLVFWLGIMRIAEKAGILQFFSALRSEEHTSELQSRGHLVCRLLLEKKKQQIKQK